eukprot:CAMPEP_0201635434 /NCGR_PEP_ID=MMETSP0493-20130528/7974_1 /ASSEMBLY_ACC=CAM_ASM_000838 /TAXON_ID=420259 /ORGANISM="Thalassiosira gravida, Strain GMp14c1" /LENGTH=248 /DNA_ID=CAMNT_0048107403 /DNA_START=30 /DNA_END=776 /DNA_ORIENTATION=+
MRLTAVTPLNSLLVVLIAGLVCDSLKFSCAWSPSSSGISSSIRPRATTRALFLSNANGDVNENVVDDAYSSESPTISITNSSTSGNRRRMLHQTLAATLAVSTARPARADVTNKIASSSALRALGKVQTQLPIKLLPEAQSNNYAGVNACLREPPFDTLRKNMLILVRGGEDGPKAKELTVASKRLIGVLEAMDATASLGIRGGKTAPDPFRLGMDYEDVVREVYAFVKVGTEAAGIPLQVESSMRSF